MFFVFSMELGKLILKFIKRTQILLEKNKVEEVALPLSPLIMKL